MAISIIEPASIIAWAHMHVCMGCHSQPKMCSAYSVPSYPHLILGRAAGFVSRNASLLTHSGALVAEAMVNKTNELFFADK